MPQNEHSMVKFGIEQNLSLNRRPVNFDILNSPIAMAIEKLKNNPITKRVDQSFFLKHNKWLCRKGQETKCKTIRSRGILFRIGSENNWQPPSDHKGHSYKIWRSNLQWVLFWCDSWIAQNIYCWLEWCTGFHW